MRAGRERLIVALAGVALLLLGVAGFAPGVTTHLEALAFAGRSSNAMLLGSFKVSVLANLVHGALGTVGIAWAWSDREAGSYLVGAAVVNLALWGLGTARFAGRLPVNTADNYLHFVLALVLLAASAVARGAWRPQPGSARAGRAPVL